MIVCELSDIYIVYYRTLIVSLWLYIEYVRKPLRELNKFYVNNNMRRFGTSKMHLIPSVA